eukprot:scaffold12800_cov56-Phaeocystis_antarctica.AAC.2
MGVWVWAWAWVWVVPTCAVRSGAATPSAASRSRACSGSGSGSGLGSGLGSGSGWGQWSVGRARVEPPQRLHAHALVLIRAHVHQQRCDRAQELPRRVARRALRGDAPPRRVHPLPAEGGERRQRRPPHVDVLVLEGDHQAALARLLHHAALPLARRVARAAVFCAQHAVDATRVPLPISPALQGRRAADLASALARRSRDQALRGYAREWDAGEQAARVASDGDIVIGQQGAKLHEDCARVERRRIAAHEEPGILEDGRRAPLRRGAGWGGL